MKHYVIHQKRLFVHGKRVIGSGFFSSLAGKASNLYNQANSAVQKGHDVLNRGQDMLKTAKAKANRSALAVTQAYHAMSTPTDYAVSGTGFLENIKTPKFVKQKVASRNNIKLVI